MLLARWLLLQDYRRGDYRLPATKVAAPDGALIVNKHGDFFMTISFNPQVQLNHLSQLNQTQRAQQSGAVPSRQAQAILLHLHRPLIPTRQLTPSLQQASDR